MCLSKMYTYIDDLHIIPTVSASFMGATKGIPTPNHSLFILTIQTKFHIKPLLKDPV